jgi:hypothetical protein
MNLGKFLTISTLLLYYTQISSQAVLLDKGQSGLNIGVQYFGVNTVSSVGTGIGYSPNGLLNIGLTISKASFENVDNYGEFSISPYLQYFFIKEDYDIPLSVSATVGYVRTTDTGRFLQDFGVDLIGNSFYGSLLMIKNFDASDKFRILPYLQTSYISTRATLTDGRNSESTTTDAFNVGLGFIGAIKVNENYFNISPALIFEKNNTGFRLYISYNINY